MASRRIRHMIVDMDGTMLDNRQQCYFAVKQTLRHFGAGANFFQDDMRAIWGLSVEGFWRMAGIPKYVPFHEIDDKFWEFYPNFPHITPFEGAGEAACRISFMGIPISLLSAARQQDIAEFCDVPVRRGMKMYDILTYIHPRCVAEKKAAIAEVIQNVGAKPETTAYVEDSPSALTAAKELGLLTVGMLEGYASEARIRAACPEELIRTPAELADIVKNYL